IIKELIEMGAEVKAYDPEAIESVKKYTDLDIEYADNQYDALGNADALLIVTEWNEFRTPDFDRIKASLKQPVIFDGRNVYDLPTMKESGFEYFSIGRSAITRSEETLATND
ncbi:MAG: UDP binding domain-containing protein, partial [Bacteroidota bacterium]